MKQKQPKNKTELSNAEELMTDEGDSLKQPTRVLMIDLENCPGQAHELMDNVNQYTQVVVCFAQCGAKIPLDWVVPLTQTVTENRLKIIKMPNGGKNSADFGLSFWAGALMAQLPTDAQFDIVSNDADLDHVTDLLKSQGREAKRIGVKKNIQLDSLVARKNEPDLVTRNYLQEYCLHLVNHNKSRPAKQETLLNNIKSKFKSETLDPQIIFNELRKKNAISLNEKKVTYNQTIIDKLSTD